MPLAPNVVVDDAIPTAVASSFVAPVASVVVIACWPRCAAIAASCATLSASFWYFVALLAIDYVAACCRLVSLSAFLSSRV